MKTLLLILGLCMIISIPASAANNTYIDFFPPGTFNVSGNPQVRVGVTEDECTAFCPTVNSVKDPAPHGNGVWQDCSNAANNSYDGWLSCNGNTLEYGLYPPPTGRQENFADDSSHSLSMCRCLANAQNGWESFWYVKKYYRNDMALPEILVEADFTGTPLSAINPNLITLTDASRNTTGSTVYNWSITPTAGSFFSQTTTKNTTVYLNQPGYYNISHGVENLYGSDIETKTDYVYIYDDNSTSTTGCLAVNGATGMRIGGAQVDLFDIENNTWSNTTTTEGLGIITTIRGHTLNCYGSATGFSDGDLLNQPEKDGQYYTLNLWPSVGYANVSAGYVTLYITVTDIATGLPIAGATVSGGDSNYGVMANSEAFSLTTNSHGMTSVPVKNNTMIYLTAYKIGYNTQTQAVNSGTGSGGDSKVSAWIKLSKTTIGPTATLTTGPGGTIPTTVNPYNLMSSDEKQGELASEVLNYGPMLVQLFILLTIVGGIKLISK